MNVPDTVLPGPTPPTNVRLVLADGRVVPVDCVYRGYGPPLPDAEPRHLWVIVTVYRAEITRIMVDVLPAYTTILGVLHPGDLARWPDWAPPDARR